VSRPNLRKNGWRVALALVAALVMACGSSSATPKAPANQITGAATCPAAETQAITFSGALTGHVSCATSRPVCSTTAATPSLVVPINALAGSTAVELLITFRFFRANMTQDQPGTYAAGKLGEEEDSLDNGVTLDGIGHWETPTPGGSMTLSAEDAAGASGNLDVKLTYGVKTVAVTGSWRCVKSASS
jgi:hypothetical protein